MVQFTETSTTSEPSSPHTQKAGHFPARPLLINRGQSVADTRLPHTLGSVARICERKRGSIWYGCLRDKDECHRGAARTSEQGKVAALRASRCNAVIAPARADQTIARRNIDFATHHRSTRTPLHRNNAIGQTCFCVKRSTKPGPAFPPHLPDNIVAVVSTQASRRADSCCCLPLSLHDVGDTQTAASCNARHVPALTRFEPRLICWAKYTCARTRFICRINEKSQSPRAAGASWSAGAGIELRQRDLVERAIAVHRRIDGYSPDLRSGSRLQRPKPLRNTSVVNVNRHNRGCDTATPIDTRRELNSEI